MSHMYPLGQQVFSSLQQTPFLNGHFTLSGHFANKEPSRQTPINNIDLIIFHFSLTDLNMYAKYTPNTAKYI
jgi:hypothetical protein